MPNKRAVLDSEEQEIMDHILAATAGIHKLGLRTNAVELTQAVHTLQTFVILHMLHRIEPAYWGKWYAR